jgi:hypothetical protein
MRNIFENTVVRSSPSTLANCSEATDPGVVLGEVAHQRVDLEQRPLDWVAVVGAAGRLAKK